MADHKGIRKSRMVPADRAHLAVSPKLRYPCQRCGVGPGSNCGRWRPNGEWVVNQTPHKVRGTPEEVKLLKKPDFDAVYSEATFDIVNLDTLLD